MPMLPGNQPWWGGYGAWQTKEMHYTFSQLLRYLPFASLGSCCIKD